MIGLLDGISTEEKRRETFAAIEERKRITRQLAEQMGVSEEEALAALWHFEFHATSAGQEPLH